MTIDLQSALRAEMLDRVERTRLPGWRRRLPVITAGVALALGGAGVAAANGWLSEGDRSIEVLGDPVSLTVDEPTVLNLGAMPEQADAVHHRSVPERGHAPLARRWIDEVQCGGAVLLHL